MSILITYFFFNDTATTEIYTLSLHDALPILHIERQLVQRLGREPSPEEIAEELEITPEEVREIQRMSQLPISLEDRKSTRLNSSHSQISYAVFCLKKKKQTTSQTNCTYTQTTTTTHLIHVHSYHLFFF